MSNPDLNLLVTLDAVLLEGSVTRAAQRLGLSPSAMSRALARLRGTTGDPLLVRAGRGLVPTPRAIELRARVSQLVQEAEALLRPVAGFDMKGLERTIRLRARDGFVENFGPELMARVEAEAPGVRLCFLDKENKEGTLLRDGRVDLEIGVVGEATSPELRAQSLFSDRYVGVVRRGHTLSEIKITASRYAKGRHIAISRRGLDRGPIDEVLKQHGLERCIAAIASSFTSALALARGSDLIASVPERQTEKMRAEMYSFKLPVEAPRITISLLWHPRFEADPAHRWIRGVVLAICRKPV